jgi:hypothetical protein
MRRTLYIAAVCCTTAIVLMLWRTQVEGADVIGVPGGALGCEGVVCAA